MPKKSRFVPLVALLVVSVLALSLTSWLALRDHGTTSPGLSSLAAPADADPTPTTPTVEPPPARVREPHMRTQRVVDAETDHPIVGLALTPMRTDRNTTPPARSTDERGAFEVGDEPAIQFASATHGAGYFTTPRDRLDEPVRLARTVSAHFDVTLVDTESTRVRLRARSRTERVDDRVTRDEPQLLEVDASGMRVVNGLVPGWYSVLSAAEGHAVSPAIVFVGPGARPIALRVGALADRMLSGLVCDEAGTPCADVAVAVGPRVVKSDAAGRFRLVRGPEDDAYVHLDVARGDVRFRPRISFGPVLFGDEVRIVLEAMTADRLQVRRSGTAVRLQSPRLRSAIARTQLGGADPGFQDVPLTTDRDWLVVPPRTPPESTLVGELDGRPFAVALAEFAVEREAGGTRDLVHAIPESLPMRVLVRDENGMPLPDALVEVVTAPSLGLARSAKAEPVNSSDRAARPGLLRVEYLTAATTDAFGEAVVQFALTPKTFVRANVSGHASAAVPVPVARPFVQLVLHTTHALRGRIVDLRGAPIGHATGNATFVSDRAIGAQMQSAPVRDGTFELQTEATSGWIEYDPSIRTTDDESKSMVHVDNGQQEVVIVFDDAARVAVRLVLSGEPGPQPGDELRVVRELEIEGVVRPRLHCALVTRTEANTVVATSAWTPGTYSIQWTDPRTGARVRGNPRVVLGSTPVDVVCDFTPKEVVLALRRKDRPELPVVRPVVAIPPYDEIAVGDANGQLRLPHALPGGTVLRLVEPADGAFRPIGRTEALQGLDHEVVLCTEDDR